MILHGFCPHSLWSWRRHPGVSPSSRSVSVCILFSFVLTTFANTTRSQGMGSHAYHQVVSPQHGFRDDSEFLDSMLCLGSLTLPELCSSASFAALLLSALRSIPTPHHGVVRQPYSWLFPNYDFLTLLARNPKKLQAQDELP
jgi:hypothetical protein